MSLVILLHDLPVRTRSVLDPAVLTSQHFNIFSMANIVVKMSQWRRSTSSNRSLFFCRFYFFFFFFFLKHLPKGSVCLPNARLCQMKEKTNKDIMTATE